MNDELLARMLVWRNVETPCTVCKGSGVRAYPSTATWHGGIGGQMMTMAVCDHCWGSGDEHIHWTDLRQLPGERRALAPAITDKETAEAEVKALQRTHTAICEAVVATAARVGIIAHESNNDSPSYWVGRMRGEIEWLRGLLGEVVGLQLRGCDKSVRDILPKRLSRRVDAALNEEA